jgi:hypothetical protein
MSPPPAPSDFRLSQRVESGKVKDIGEIGWWEAGLECFFRSSERRYLAGDACLVLLRLAVVAKGLFVLFGGCVHEAGDGGAAPGPGA